MRFIISISAFMLTALALASCAPRTLEPGSETVKVSYNASIARNCKFKGDVTLENIHGDMLITASQQERELDDINFLKNEGKRLGANLVVLAKHDQIVTEQKNLSSKPHLSRRSVTYDIQGKAYLCPTNIAQSQQSLNATYLQHNSETAKK